MARFIAVTVTSGDTALYVNASAIAEFKVAAHGGTLITMRHSKKEDGALVVHNVTEPVEEVAHRISEDEPIGRGLDHESRLERVKAAAERVRLKLAREKAQDAGSPRPAEG
jgi:hypothetical protein